MCSICEIIRLILDYLCACLSLFYSLVGLIAVIFVYFYVSAKEDPELLEKTAIYCSVALTLTCVASFSAVGVSLSTYALAHQFFTGGAYYVKV